MKKELQQSLFEAYPNLYHEHILDMTQSTMHWAVAVGDGWYTIIRDLSQELQSIIEREKLDPKAFCFSQIKEKLGLLRIYFRSHNLEISKAIARAEERSSKICESCGEEGRYFNEGYMRTSCESCQEGWRERKRQRGAKYTTEEVSGRWV